MRLGKITLRGLWLLAGLAAFFVLSPVAVNATCGVSWTNATTIATGSYLRSVTYGAGKYVAVGDAGAIITSPDANYWTLQAKQTQDNLWAVVYAGGKFVVVGGKTTFTSTDGQTWNKVYVTNATGLTGLAYGNGVFVAVGLNATIMTSPDGVNWTLKYSTGPDLEGVFYNDGKFVAVGAYGVTAISDDGGNTFTVYPASVSTTLWGITYGDGQWVCVGDNGTAFTSPDGRVWTQQSPHTQNHLYDVTYAADLFIAVGKSGTIVFSPDAIAWSIGTSQYQADLHGIGYGGDFFIAAGQAAALRNYCQATHAISGQVTVEGGDPAPNVQLELSGASTTNTPTANDGTYSFENLADGAYTVTPSYSGNVFEPPSLDVTLSGQDVTGVDFTMKSAVNPPVITSVLKASNPFRLKVMGSNFHPDCAVHVNGTGVTTVYKNSGLLVAKNVASLIPKGATVQITVINGDGGVSAPFSFKR